MPPRFISSSKGQAARRRTSSLLVIALLMAGLLLYKYAASAASIIGSVPKGMLPQQSLLSSLRFQLASSIGDVVGNSTLGTTAGTSSSGSEGGDGREEKDGSHSRRATQQRLIHKPIAKPDPAVVEERCGAALGDWCGRYEAQQPIPARPPPKGTKKCLWGCNFVGVCDAAKGWCRCPAGWTGDDCSTRMKRPCSQHLRRHGFEPYNQPVDLAAGASTTMACADYCDEDIAACFCNSTYAHGRLPADPHLPPGTPPQRHGRPIAHMCRRNSPAHWGNVDPEQLYGKDGWCESESPSYHCPCLLDGFGGHTCETATEAYCPNQCNGHGDCNMGFCKCHEDWWGQDCAYRTAGTPWSPGMEEGERPWLKPHVHTPAARDPEAGATRKRPLIYVYELPAFYNSVMLQYRVSKSDCVHRLFDDNNSTVLNDPWLYNPEPGLHEMLLQSKHRTLDPDEADYFYLPVYTSCLIFPILGANDFPFFHGGPVALRTHAATNMLIEVYHWIRAHYPYWDRNGGRDHMLLTVHDEGSCWVPAVLRPAIILSHWGRTEFPHVSGTGYWPDNYTADSRHDVWQPEGHVGKLGDFPCYDSKKDMVIPLMSSPRKYQDSPMLGAPTRNRSVLGFFKGRIQQDNPSYSRGTRQFLANITRDEDWWGKHKIYIGEGMPPGMGSGYSEMLASSTFCFALMGDGYSSRFDDAVLNGCIPIIVQDGVEMCWSSLLDVDSYSVRVEQKDMKRIPDILKAISKKDIARMQANLAKVWRRHVWTGYRPYGDIARQMLRERKEATEKAEVKSQPPSATDYDPAQDDALDTLMQWLYSRLDDLGAHAKPSRAGVQQ